MTYSLKWIINFSYLDDEWKEETGNWSEGCLKMMHMNGNISLLGETIESKTAWMFDADSLDLLVSDLLVVSIFPNTNVKKKQCDHITLV